MAVLPPTRQCLLRKCQWPGPQKRLVLPGGFGGDCGGGFGGAAAAAGMVGGAAAARVAEAAAVVGTGLDTGGVWGRRAAYLATALVAGAKRPLALGRGCAAGYGMGALAMQRRPSNSRNRNKAQPSNFANCSYFLIQSDNQLADAAITGG